MRNFYRIDDENRAVRALQTRLRTLAAVDDRIPAVFIDGIYGEETENAVRAFQEINGISADGQTDFLTFRLLNDAYGKRLLQLEARAGAPDFERLEGGAISPGDRTDAVIALQILFRSLAEQDDRFSVPVSGVYDESTLDAVRLFDLLRGRESTGRVDRVFWNELSDFAFRPTGN